MKSLGLLILSGILSVTFVLFYSDTTSPLFSFNYTTDSSAYMLMGKAIVSDKLPYIDIWELKGPAIFYIEALGFWLTNSKNGIFLIQILFLSLTLFFNFKTYRIEYSNRTSFFLVLLSILSLSLNYQGGNLIEEFTLPLLALSVYLLYDWTKAPTKEGLAWHNPISAFVYGAVLGFSLMTRLTDALGICAAVMVVGVYLIIHKQWRNLIQNVVTYLIGFLMMVLPFCLYFYIKGALYEMWFGTFIFNLSYAASSSVGGISDFSSFKGFLIAFVNSYGLMLVGIAVLVLNRSRKLASIMWISMGGILFLWYINSNGYGHYGMLAMPHTCIILNELLLLSKNTSSVKVICSRSFFVSYIFFLTFFGTWNILNQHKKIYEPFSDFKFFNEIMSNIPKQDNEEFIAYNVDPSIYIIGNCFPCYKYDATQDWLIEMSNEMYDRIYDEFVTCKAKWILVLNNSEGCGIRMSTILSSHYRPIKKWDNYILYKHN